MERNDWKQKRNQQSIIWCNCQQFSGNFHGQDPIASEKFAVFR